jgi:tetratricopeptide (TPR) repeat protein
VNVRLGALAAALLAVATFAGTMGYEFVYDDHAVVRANPAADAPGDWRAIALTPSWGGGGYRPLTTWTFAVTHAVSGSWAGGQHAANVALHAAVAALVVVVAGALGTSPPVATLAGVLFAVHPVHADAVASIVGRAELLCALFVLLAVLAQLRGSRRGWTPGRVATVVALAAAGMCSKEYALTLVLLLPLLDLLVVDDGSLAGFRAGLRGGRAVVYALVAAAALGFVALRHAVVGSSALDVHPWMNPLAFVPDHVRWLTALAVQARALGLLALPVGLRPDYSGPTLPLVTDVASAPALAGIGVAASLVVLAVALARRHRPAAFWLLLSGVSWGLVSNLVVPVGVVFAERLLYLPSVGSCVLAALGVGWTAARLGRPALVGAVAAVACVVALPLAWRAHGVWRDDVTHARAMAAGAPESAHARHVLGTAYAMRGRLDEALGAFDAALALDPGYAGSLYNAALARRARGELPVARGLLRRLVRRRPDHVLGWIALAATELDLGHAARALAVTEHALARAPRSAELHVERALALAALDRRPAAADAFRDALRIAPDLAAARRGLAGVGGA